MDLSAFIADFFDEARERLASINEGLVAFENKSLSDDGLVQLRRDAHTIKGSALMLGVNDLGGVAHLFEDVMEYLIDHKEHRVDAIVQFLFDLHDLMETRMQDAKAEGDLPSKDLRRQYDVLLDQLQRGEMAGSDSNNSNDNDDYVDDSSSMDMGGIDLSEFTSAFFDEARGLLSKINELLVSFELEQLDDDGLVELRRNAHTIKGSALMLGIQDIGDVGHLFEDAMEKIIDNPDYRTSDMVQFLFDLHDHLSERLEDSETPTSKLTIHKLRTDYEKLLADAISEVNSDANIVMAATEEVTTEEVTTESNDVDDDFFGSNDAMGGIDLSEFTAAFFDEARELLSGINELLVEFENEQLDTEGLIQLRRNAHTIKGSALMLGVNDVGNVGHLFEDAMEHIIDNAEHRTPEMVQFLFDLHDKLEVRLADPDNSQKLSADPLRVEYETLLVNISTGDTNANENENIVEIEIVEEDLDLGIENIETTSIEETPATILGGDMFGGDFNMGEFINAFYDEARELLTEMKPLLQAFSTTGISEHDLMILRRNAHTIRGSSLMLGLQDIGDVGQLFEDTMAYVIEHPEFQCADVIDFLKTLQIKLQERVNNTDTTALLESRELRQDYARLMRRVSSDLDARKTKSAADKAQAKAKAEEQARRQAAAKAKAEEQARRQAAAKAQAEAKAEEQARRQAAAKAEEQARRQAAAKAQVKAKAEEQARRQAAAKAQAKAEELARQKAAAKAEEQARRQAAAKAQAEAAEQARRQAAAKAKAEANELARQQAAAKAEEQARRQAATKAKAEAEEQARRQAAAKAEEQARRQAAAKAEEQARRQAAAKAEEQARRRAIAKAKAEVEEQARYQAAAKVKAEAEEQERRQAAAKAEEQARRQAAAKAKAEAERKAAAKAKEQARRQTVIKEKTNSGIKKDSSSIGMDTFLGEMFLALKDEEPKDYPDVLIQPLDKLFTSKAKEEKKVVTAEQMFRPSQTQEVEHFDFAAPKHEAPATDTIVTTVKTAKSSIKKEVVPEEMIAVKPSVRKQTKKMQSESEDFVAPTVAESKTAKKIEAAPEDMLAAFDAGDSKQKTIKSSRKVSTATAAPVPKVTDVAPDDLLAAFDAGSTDYNKAVEQTKSHAKTTATDKAKPSVKIDSDKIQNLSLEQFDNDSEADDEEKLAMDFRPDVSQMTMHSGQRTSSGRFLRVDAERLNSLSNQVVELSMEKAQGENLGLQFRELVRDLNGLMQQWQQFSGRIDNFASVDQRKSVIENIDNVFLQRVKTAKRFVDELQHEHGKRGLMLDGLRDQVLGLMLRPLDSIFSTFPRAVRDAAKRYKKKVRLVVSGESVELDQSVAERLVEPMVHLLNNSIAHGVEMPDVRKKNGKRPDGQITIVALQNGSEVRIDIFDDGGGIDAEKVKRVAVDKGVTTQREADDMSTAEALEMIFRPGFSTHDKVDMMAGRGIGMNVVQDTLRKLTGNIRIHTEIGRGTCFTITLPVSIAVQQGLLFRIGSQRLGILAHLVDQVIMLHMQKITKTKGGKKSISYKNHTVPLVDLRQVFADEDINDDHGLVVVAKHIEGFVGIVIDELIDEMEVVVRDLDPYIKRYQVPGLMGTTIIGDGSVVLLIEPYGIKEMGRTAPDQSLTSEVVGTINRTLHVLLAEDSMIARQIEKKLLVDAGFTVDTAIDGMDAVEKMRRHEYDLLITDLEMPRLDGFGLVRQVRAEAKYADLPILVISTRESAKDRLRSLEAGADAYLIKQSLQQGYMLETIESLVGPLTIGGDDINQTLAELNQ
ncbi:MAG: Hpt domain-containing protein [Mariprofundales bacterium]